jgi:hypothetical protein
MPILLALVTLTAVVLAFELSSGARARRAEHWWRPLFALLFGALILRVGWWVEGFNPWASIEAFAVDTGLWGALASFAARLPESLRAPFGEGGDARALISAIWGVVNQVVGIGLILLYLLARLLFSGLWKLWPDSWRAAMTRYLTRGTYQFEPVGAFVYRRHRYVRAALGAYSSVALGVLYGQLIGWRPASDWSTLWLLPALLYLFAGEIAKFLGGRHYEPPPRPLAAEVGLPTPWLRDLNELEARYREVWPTWLLAAGSHPSEPEAGESKPIDADSEAILAARLTRGEDVLVIDTLPLQLAPVLRHHLQERLWAGFRLVLVVEHEDTIEAGREALTRLLVGFRARVFTAIDPDLEVADALVMTVRQSLNERVRRNFAGHPCLLLIADANATALWHAGEIRALREELAELSGALPQVIAFADWQAGIEGAMRSAMGFAVQAVRPRALERPTRFMAWRSEGRDDRGSFEAGVVPAGLHARTTHEAALTVPAVESGADALRLVMQRRQPFADALGSLANTRDQWRPSTVAARLDAQPTVVIPGAFDLTEASMSTAVVIARDEKHDLLWTARKWASLSEGGTLVHVVAPPYLYRGLFAKRLATTGLRQRHAFSPLAPEVDGPSRFQRCFELYRRLERSWVDQRLVLAELEAIDPDGPSSTPLAERLERVFRDSLELEELGRSPEFRTRYLHTPEGALQRVHEVRLGHGAASPAVGWLRKVEIRAPESHQPPLALEYAGEFYQRYLPLQTHAFGASRAVRLTGVNGAAGVATTTAVSLDSHAWREAYRQDRSFTPQMDEARLQERVRVADLQRCDVAIDLFEVPLTVRTHGYLAFASADAMDLDRATYEPLHFDATAEDALRFVPERHYRRGKLLRLRFVGLPEPLRESSPALAFTFALLLSESLRSYYPHLHPYVAVAVAPSLRPAADDAYLERLGRLVADIHAPPEAPADGFDVYVIEDSHFDRGALRGLGRYLMDGVLPDLAAYLAIAEEDAFLRFGRGELPAALGLAGVREVLASLRVRGHC